MNQTIDHMMAIEIVGLYLKESNSQAIFIEIISKDWHQFMERDIRWRYVMRGIVAEIAEVRHGYIPWYHI